MLPNLAPEGTNQVRPDPVGPFGSIATHFAIGRQGCRRNCLRGDRTLGEGHPENVRSDATSLEIFVRLC